MEYATFILDLLGLIIDLLSFVASDEGKDLMNFITSDEGKDLIFIPVKFIGKEEQKKN